MNSILRGPLKDPGKSPIETKILNADVSENWKERFRKIESACPIAFPTGYQNLNRLTFKERFKVFNFWAFLFGPFYYFFKGMPKKGLFLLCSGMMYVALLDLIAFNFKLNIPAVIYSYAFSYICFYLANYDYYRSIVYKESMWKILSFFENNAIFAMYCIGSIAFSILIFALEMPLTSQ